MSVKDPRDPSNGEVIVKRGRRSFNRCISIPEIKSLESGPLAKVDSKKLKMEIKRWAKAVVAYARQVSDRFGSSRRG